MDPFDCFNCRNDLAFAYVRSKDFYLFHFVEKFKGKGQSCLASVCSPSPVLKPPPFKHRGFNGAITILSLLISRGKFPPFARDVHINCAMDRAVSSSPFYFSSFVLLSSFSRGHACKHKNFSFLMVGLCLHFPENNGTRKTFKKGPGKPQRSRILGNDAEILLTSFSVARKISPQAATLMTVQIPKLSIPASGKKNFCLGVFKIAAA